MKNLLLILALALATTVSAQWKQGSFSDSSDFYPYVEGKVLKGADSNGYIYLLAKESDDGYFIKVYGLDAVSGEKQTHTRIMFNFNDDPYYTFVYEGAFSDDGTAFWIHGDSSANAIVKYYDEDDHRIIRRLLSNLSNIGTLKVKIEIKGGTDIVAEFNLSNLDILKSNLPKAEDDPFGVN